MRSALEYSLDGRDTLSGKVVEFVVRVVKPDQGDAQLQLVMRDKAGLSVLNRSFARRSVFTASEVEDILGGLRRLVVEHLVVTAGVQLVLSVD
jgi:hypothetical protein